MSTPDDLARGDGARLSGGQDLPRPPLSPSDRLLRALVIAWDLDDEQAFQEALSKARLHIGVMGVLPKVTIKRRES